MATKPTDDAPAGRWRTHLAFGMRMTLKAWSRDERCPISDQGLYHRVLTLGLSVEAAFAVGPFVRGRVTVRTKRIGRRRRLVTAWGETRSAYDWAADPRARVSAEVILTRLNRGFTPEQAIGLAANRHRRYPDGASGGGLNAVTAWGETKSAAAWAADPRAKASAVTIRRRLDAGYTPEQAIAIPLHHHRRSHGYEWASGTDETPVAKRAKSVN